MHFPLIFWDTYICINAFLYFKILCYFRIYISSKVLTALNIEGNWVTYLALSIASVRCTLLSWPKQNLSPPEGST